MRILIAPDKFKSSLGAREVAENIAIGLRDVLPEAKIDIVFPVEANAVFARMNEKLVRDLHGRGWHFYKFIQPDIYRLMCSWSVTDQDISDFISDVASLNH